MARLFQPAYPMLCMTLVLLLVESRLLPRLSEAAHSRLGSASRPTLLVALGLTLVFISTTVEPVHWWKLKSAPLLLNEFKLAEDRMSRGRGLAEFFAASDDLPSVGVIASGAIKRSYPGEVVGSVGSLQPPALRPILTRIRRRLRHKSPRRIDRLSQQSSDLACVLRRISCS